MKELKLGICRHYKGGMYKVLGTAHHSETLEELVLYQALYESKEFGKDSLWVRPKAMFLEEVVFNGEKVPRFAYVEQNDVKTSAKK